MERDGLTFIVRIIKCCYLSQSEKRNDREHIRVNCLGDMHRHTSTSTRFVFFTIFHLKHMIFCLFIFLSVHFQRMTSTLFLNEKVINVYALFSCRLKPLFYRVHIFLANLLQVAKCVASFYLQQLEAFIAFFISRDGKQVQIIRRHFCTSTLV